MCNAGVCIKIRAQARTLPWKRRRLALRHSARAALSPVFLASLPDSRLAALRRLAEVQPRQASATRRGPGLAPRRHGAADTAVPGLNRGSPSRLTPRDVKEVFGSSCTLARRESAWQGRGEGRAEARSESENSREDVRLTFVRAVLRRSPSRILQARRRVRDKWHSRRKGRERTAQPAAGSSRTARQTLLSLHRLHASETRLLVQKPRTDSSDIYRHARASPTASVALPPPSLNTRLATVPRPPCHEPGRACTRRRRPPRTGQPSSNAPTRSSRAASTCVIVPCCPRVASRN